MSLLLVIFQLILVDLIMGGDNAVVIAMATKSLEPKLKRKASVIGAIIAIALRIVFVIILLLVGQMKIPFLNIVCGALLIYIAIDLVKKEDEEIEVKQEKSLKKAITTIVLADLVMSLDNVIALVLVAAESSLNIQGQVLLVFIALLISFPIILFGASILSNLIKKYFFIVYIFGFLLVHIAVDLILKDHIFEGFKNILESYNVESFFTYTVAFIVILISIYVLNKKGEK